MCLVAVPGCPETSAACGGDRPALAACSSVGLFHADCGGDVTPVLACDRATGACRWFSGGCVAAGYADTDCAIANICCHPSGFGMPDSGWPFASWRPTDTPLLRRVQEELPLLAAGVIDQSGPVLLPVTEDSTLVAPVRPVLTCDDASTGIEYCGVPDLVHQPGSSCTVVRWPP